MTYDYVFLTKNEPDELVTDILGWEIIYLSRRNTTNSNIRDHILINRLNDIT